MEIKLNRMRENKLPSPGKRGQACLFFTGAIDFIRHQVRREVNPLFFD